MEKELIKVFQKARYEEKPDLAQNVWHSLVIRNKHITRLKLWAFSFVGLTSLVGLIPAWRILSSDLAQSGFYEYLSLIFSSGNSFFSYWKEFLFSVAESLPTMSIILSLSLIFTLFLSLRYIAKQIIIRSQLTLSF